MRVRCAAQSLDKTKCGKIGFKELNEQLVKLDYRAKRVEVEDMIWEVDEDCDHHVSWDEFKLMFHRCRNDRVRARAPAPRWPAGSPPPAPAGAPTRAPTSTRARRRRAWSRGSSSTWLSS